MTIRVKIDTLLKIYKQRIFYYAMWEVQSALCAKNDKFNFMYSTLCALHDITKKHKKDIIFIAIMFKDQ